MLLYNSILQFNELFLVFSSIASVFNFLCSVGFCLLTVFTSRPLHAEQLSVIASNQPLTLIAQQVLGDTGQATSLLQAGQSPHDFALSFSNRQKLTEASLVLWLGPNIEPYLEKLSSHNKQGNLRIDRLWSLPKNTGHSHQHHDAEDWDFHFWMSPAKAVVIAQRLTSRLSALSPQYASKLEENLQRLTADINNTDKQLQVILRRESVPYGVSHNAYSHFIEHYQLPEPMLLSHSTETSPGIRQLLAIQKQLPASSCILVEPEHAFGWPQQLSQRQNYRLVLADSLASQKSYATYSEWLTALALQFNRCLDPHHP